MGFANKNRLLDHSIDDSQRQPGCAARSVNCRGDESVAGRTGRARSGEAGRRADRSKWTGNGAGAQHGIIRSQVTGLLQSVNFVEGQQVHRDDLLAQVDPRPAEAQLAQAQAQAQLARDQAQLANLQVNLDRDVPLLSKGFATDQQVTNEKSAVVQLQSALKSDQAMIDQAQITLSYTTLTAPFDGVAGVRTLDVGNIIHPTDTVGLLTLTQVQPISVLFTLPAATIPQVQAALAAGPVTAVAYDQSGTSKLDTGRLLAADAGGQSVYRPVTSDLMNTVIQPRHIKLWLAGRGAELGVRGLRASQYWWRAPSSRGGYPDLQRSVDECPGRSVRYAGA